MLHDTCPHCGHRNKPYMMATRSDSSITEIMEGKDGPFMAGLAKYGLLVVLLLVLTGIMVALH